ncbi:methyltransferase, partial [bacterium M00.F.Ca.ET.228.01.1.1]
ANAIPSCIEALTRVGGTYGDDGRIRLPRALVLDTIKKAARNFTLCGQDPKHDMTIQGKRVHFGTAGAAVHLVDVEKREYRESLLQDLYDAARIVDWLDNIHFF